MFAASSGRQYALVIALNHISTEVRCGGLITSPAFNLKHNDGWMHFIGTMVGLASVNDSPVAWVPLSTIRESPCLFVAAGRWMIGSSGTAFAGVQRRSSELAGSLAGRRQQASEKQQRRLSTIEKSIPKVKMQRIQRKPEYNALTCFNETLTKDTVLFLQI
jgi:hypothetical protein